MNRRMDRLVTSRSPLTDRSPAAQQQQQQRVPPNLGQVPPGMQPYRQTGLGGYPTTAYSMPPTSTMQQQQQQQQRQQNYAAIPSRMASTPGYLPQQRGANNSYFGPSSAMSIPGMQPPPSSGTSSLSSMQTSSSLALQQQQQQNAAMHLAAAATGTSSHSSENVIDQSDFPPLGSATGGNVIGANPSSQGSAGFHSTYASQAGTGGQTVTGNATTTTTAAAQRDFGHDEFPPLGAQTGSNMLHGQDGLTNGFGSQGVQSQDQARQLMFGGGVGQTATSQRGMQGLSSELDKRVSSFFSGPIITLRNQSSTATILRQAEQQSDKQSTMGESTTGHLIPTRIPINHSQRTPAPRSPTEPSPTFVRIQRTADLPTRSSDSSAADSDPTTKSGCPA